MKGSEDLNEMPCRSARQKVGRSYDTARHLLPARAYRRRRIHSSYGGVPFRGFLIAYETPGLLKGDGEPKAGKGESFFFREKSFPLPLSSNIKNYYNMNKAKSPRYQEVYPGSGLVDHSGLKRHLRFEKRRSRFRLIMFNAHWYKWYGALYGYDPARGF